MIVPFGIGWFWVMPFRVFFRLNQETSEKILKTQVSSAFPLAHPMPHAIFQYSHKKNKKSIY